MVSDWYVSESEHGFSNIVSMFVSEEAAQQEWDKEKEKKQQRALHSMEAKSATQLPFIQLSKPRQRRRFLSLRYWRTSIKSRKAAIGQWWTSPEVYRLRLHIDEVIQSFQNSRHLKHAFKCAFGISLLTLPGHLPADYEGVFAHKHHNCCDRFERRIYSFSLCSRQNTSVTQDINGLKAFEDPGSLYRSCTACKQAQLPQFEMLSFEQ